MYFAGRRMHVLCMVRWPKDVERQWHPQLFATLLKSWMVDADDR